MNDIDQSELVARTPETRPFWQAAAEGRLVLPLCEDCRQYHWYPRAVCPHCHGQNLHWKPSAGRGVIHSVAVMHRASPPEAAAIVELDEGVCVYTAIRSFDTGALAIGDRVEAIFQPVSPAGAMLVFKPAASR